MASFAVIGAGGLGGLYGALLANAGHDVHFLIREDLSAVRAQGWIVESIWGDFVLSDVQVYNRTSDMPSCDYLLIGLKSTNNSLLASLLPPTVNENTIAIVLQNGLNVEESTEAIVGPGRVIGGCCFLCANKKGPGHIAHLDYGRIEMGAYRGMTNCGPAVSTERLSDVANLFNTAKIPTTVAADLATARWRKLMWNIPFNGLSVALNASTAEIMADADARQLALDLMLEVEHSAKIQGIDTGADHVDKMMTNTERMVPYDSSMRLDFLHGRPMEIQYIFETPIAAARQANYEPLKTIMLCQQLRFLDQRNLRSQHEK